MSKIKFGLCPFCNSTEYYESISEFVNCYDTPYIIMDCMCKDCENSFTTYYSQDEVKFDKEGEEFIYNNSLSKQDKEVLLKAINLLIDTEEDINDYSRIINVLKGELNKE